MTFRYIGSKARVADAIIAHVGEPDGGTFVDAFCGTGVVAAAAAQAGWPVRLNDHLASAVTVAAARLAAGSQARFERLGGYMDALARLNALDAVEGFVWREYSPASTRRAGVERRYFTRENAGRIDAMRRGIRRWREGDEIGAVEERLLVADLISAANRVANIAGTYGCFLSRWQAQAMEPIHLKPRLLARATPDVEVSVGDARDVGVAETDTVYLDPPYTKRQYAAYYHLLETIALGDEPAVEGVCGLRPWRHIASDYCYRTRALAALRGLVGRLKARRVLLSYSAEGHVALDALAAALAALGKVTPHRLMGVGRYRPNRAATRAGASVDEYLLVLERDAASLGMAA